MLLDEHITCPYLALVHIITLKKRRTEMLFQLHCNLVLGQFLLYWENLPLPESAL